MAEHVDGRRPLKDMVRQFLSRKKSGMTPINKCSEAIYEYNCDPCKSFEEYYEAEGFCTDCKEYLCSTCFQSHSRNKVSKHHTLLVKDDMPRKCPKLCNPCKIAGDEIMSIGYCTVCTDFLCNDCFKSHPRNKLSKGHVLVKPEQIEDTEQVVATSFHKINTTHFEDIDETMTEEYIYVRDINVQSDTDKDDCYITAISPISINELVISDKNNKSLKYVDIEKNIVADVLLLPSSPLNITALSNDKIAVALTSIHQIKIISVNGRLSVDRTIKTNGKCLDVKVMGTRFYVSYFLPVKFQILKQTGTIIKTITPDKEVLKHCTYPRHIAVTPEESMIYVSDSKTNTVITLDMNGKMLAVYESDLDEPFGIIISPDRSVYICNTAQHCVFKMNSDLSEPTVILGRGDGLEHPQAVCLNFFNQNHYLYFSSGSLEAEYANALKVYKYKGI